MFAFAGRLEAWIRRATTIILLVGSIFLVSWMIPPARQWLLGKDVDPSVVVAVCGLSIFIVFRSLNDIQKSVDSIQNREHPEIISGGVLENLYPSIRECMRSHAKRKLLPRKRKKVKVLGLTLFTAWMHIKKDILSDTDYKDWEVDFYCLEPDYLRRNANIFPDTWATQSEVNIREIKEFCLERSKDLKARRITINLFTYSHFPAIHGFLINEQEAYFSAIQWDQDRRRLASPESFYEHVVGVSAAAVDERVESYGGLFLNWLEKAEASSKKVVINRVDTSDQNSVKPAQEALSK